MRQLARRFRAGRAAAAASPPQKPPPLTPDQKAAHEFLAELRTRIAIQPLPYRDGLETAALASLHSLFAASREAIKKNPGCEDFARTVTDALNICLRPTTARWHRGADDSRLASRDGGDAFRAELAEIRLKLVRLADHLNQMAYGKPFADIEVTAEIDAQELARLMRPLPFDFLATVREGSATPGEIAAEEAREVAARRALERANAPAYAPAEGMDAFGLALSGGGIRSATFCLGVAQTLADKGLLGQVDFLSTVSGGGFAGAFLNRRLAAAGAGTDLKFQVGGALGPDPEPVRYVRRLAKYLMVDRLGQRWRMATSSLAGLLLNWTPPLSALAFLAALYAQLGRNRFAAALLDPAVFAGLAVVAAVCLAGYGLAMRRRAPGAAGFGAAFGAAVGVIAALGLAWGLQAAHPALAAWQAPWLKWSTLSFGAVVSAVPTLLRFLPLAQAPALRKRILKVALALAAFVVPLLMLFVFVALLQLDTDQWKPFGIAAPRALAVALASGFVAAFGLNVNLTGPHRIYRDGIANTFVRTQEKHDDSFVALAASGGGRAPYHIVCAAVNLPSETAPALRGRKCDFFAFTKHYCGSPSTGYEKTAAWRTDRQPLDLATAAAISGAAVAPNMGLISYPTLRAMLTLLNARLSYWLRRPHSQGGGGDRAPGFLCLIREMTGWDMDTRSRWLLLSDGGHIENLGVYELLRRRCKFIVSVDAEQDGDYRFAALATVARQAQIDFGVRLRLDLGELRPKTEGGPSRAHYAFGRIDYPDAPPGFILVLKPSLTGDEDEMVKRFKGAHPEFPHHSTLDQFFDEECFEMYRRLGAHVAAGLFGKALLRGKTDPATVSEWFSALAVSLLEPKGA